MQTLLVPELTLQAPHHTAHTWARMKKNKQEGCVHVKTKERPEVSLSPRTHITTKAALHAHWKVLNYKVLSTGNVASSDLT